jgi:hypothetical protein
MHAARVRCRMYAIVQARIKAMKLLLRLLQSFIFRFWLRCTVHRRRRAGRGQ